MKIITLLIIFCFIISDLFSQQAAGKLNISFVEKGFLENKGQVKDLSGKVNSKVKFVYSRGLFNLELKEYGFSYELFESVTDNNRMDEAGYSSDSNEKEEKTMRITGSTRIDVVLEGANRNAEIVATDPTGAYFNFYHSPVKTNRIEQVKAFNTITYHDIYPGIDLVFSTPNEDEKTQLHYDFIVHAGADPNLIQLKYNGNHTININDSGALLLNTSIGYIMECKPVSFQQTEKKEIACAYAVEKNRVKYQIGEYDKSQTLIIDPNLIWATYYGGNEDEDAAKVFVDAKKKPIISGTTISASNIATTGAYQTVYGGNPSDLFVAKFNTNGKIEWASYIGGNSKDIGYGAIADESNNVILYGKAASKGLATIGQTILGGAGDAIVVKFSPKGIFQWSTYIGGSSDDHFRNMRSDIAGNLYGAGYTESPDNISTPGAFQEVYGGDGDCIISKLSSSGALIWSTYFGGAGTDRFHVVNIDLFNHLLLQGTTGSITGMTTAGVHQTIYGGGEEDVLLAEFDVNGSRIWSTYYGGEYSDRGRGVESDSAGNIYIGGLTTSESGISTVGAYQEHWAPAFDGITRLEDGYVAKFTADGQLIWGTYYGGNGHDRIWGISLDRKTNAIYVAGGTQSDNNISTSSAWQKKRVQGTDGFFARWDYDGNLVWGSYWGGLSEDHLQDVEPDGAGFIYLLGLTNQSKMPVTTGVYQTVNIGQDESMLYRFYPGLECYDNNEPNNDFTSAKQITAWSPLDTFFYGYNGNIVNGNDEDWFKIKVKASMKNIMIILSEKSKKYNLNLYNAQQVLLQSSTNPPSMNDTIIFNNAPAEYCFFNISHSNLVFDSLDCYRIKLYQSSSIFDEQLTGHKVSVNEEELITLKVFPNPGSSQFSISFTAPSSTNGQLMIYDLSGRLVATRDVLLTEGYQTLDFSLSGLLSGSYRLHLKSNDKNWIASFNKQ